MNRSIKKLFTVIVVGLMISLALTTMSRACRLNTSEIVSDITDPNDIPVETPEMTPGSSWINFISQDPNNIPEETPEMVPESSWISVISQDPNDIPEETPEMVPESTWISIISQDANDIPEETPEMVPNF